MCVCKSQQNEKKNIYVHLLHFLDNKYHEMYSGRFILIINVLLLAGLISVQRLRIEDRLTDFNNKPIDVSIH